MKRINMLGLCMMFILAFAVCVSSAPMPDNLTLTYSNPSDGGIIAQEVITGSESITIPSTALDVMIESSNGSFVTEIDALDVSGISELNLSARTLLPTDIENDSLNIGVPNTYRYWPRLAYAFSIDNEDDVNSTYRISLNHSNAGVSGTYNLVVFQFDYDFTTDTVDYGSYSSFSGSRLNTAQDSVWLETDGFSVFVLAEDTGAPVSQPTTSGGGGGGGGMRSTPKLLTVVPTTEGVVVSAGEDSVFNVVYAGRTYPIKLTYLNRIYAKLSNELAEEEFRAVRLIPNNLDLDEDGDDDIRIVLVDKSFVDGTFEFTLLAEKPSFASLPILPPRKEEEQPREEAAPTPVERNRIPISSLVTSRDTAESEPEPIDETGGSIPPQVWIIVGALVLIAIAIGGYFGYKKFVSHNQPPTAVRGGLGVPLQGSELLSAGSKSNSFPDSVVTPSEVNKVDIKSEIAESESDAEALLGVVESAHPDQPGAGFLKKLRQVRASKSARPAPVKVSAEQVKRVEKYVYHGLSEGFDKEHLRAALVRKGWPQNIIDDVFEHIYFTDEHLEEHNLHLHTETDRAIVPVRKLLAKGFDEEHIREGLKRKGWKPEQIDDLLSKV